MSDVTPAQPSPPGSAETLQVGPARGTRGRRTAVVALVTVVLLTVVSAGAWAAYQFFYGGGPRPAEVLPGSTVAVVSIDLNPSASQKIQAIRTIRKFPALKKSLGLQADDDLRKLLVEKLAGAGDCDGLDYADDVEPWIGKRAAFAAVDLGDDVPVPVLAVQVGDADKARQGFAALVDCAGGGDEVGFAIGEDYLIASDSTEHARAVLRAGEKDALADDEDYQRWTKEAGPQGVLNFYVSPNLTRYVDDLLDAFGGEIFGAGPGSGSGTDLGSGFGAGASTPRAADDDPLGPLADQLKKFEGLAGTVRFAGSGTELSFASGGLQGLAGTAEVGDQIGSLPADTAIALGFGVPDDYAEDFVDGFDAAAGDDADDLLAGLEDQSGLDLPGDLQTLLGSALTLSLGGDAPASLDDLQGPADLPVGLVIHGDAAAIKEVVSRIEERTGYRLSDIDLKLSGDDDRVVISPSDDYAAQLLRSGGLGRDKDFRKAVPDLGRTTALLYLDLDSPWRETLLDLAAQGGAAPGDVDVAAENTDPLKAVGFSATVDHGVSHVLLKIATD